MASKVPIVRVANSRITRTIKQSGFEPFPFKVDESNKMEVMKKLVTPLYNVPYEEQLESKESHCRTALRSLAQSLYKLGTPVRLDVRRLPCRINSIIRSPELYKYRNKDELSIWRGHDGKTNTVGYMAFPIGKHGDSVAIEPNGCEIMKDETIRLVDILQDFIRNQAKLSVSYSLGTDGGWRRFMIRSNLEGHLMLVGVLNPTTYNVQTIINERETFKEFTLKKASETGLSLKSLYFQPCPHNKCLHKDIPFELLYGEKIIKETINGYSFEVSPESYLHQNTKSAEVYYETVRNTILECFPLEENQNKPLIIDVSCGIGALAIHIADLASTIVGIDQSSQAVEDARANAAKNGIKNVEFLSSNLEIVIERILEKYSKQRNDILIVCNPRSTGLRPQVVKTLRECKEVKRIIYSSPRITNGPVINNIIDLCKKEGGRAGQPFAPIMATPIDLYPHLASCELIMAFERMPE